MRSVLTLNLPLLRSSLRPEFQNSPLPAIYHSAARTLCLAPSHEFPAGFYADLHDGRTRILGAVLKEVVHLFESWYSFLTTRANDQRLVALLDVVCDQSGSKVLIR